MPEVRILVHREGETIAEAVEPVAEALKEEAPAAEAPVVETPVVEEASTPAETKE
jgi:hypothetical protein